MSNEANDEIKTEVHELVRQLFKLEDYLIAPPEVQEATISGKRGIFGEPSYKELTIKLKYIEESTFIAEKKKHLNDLLAALNGDIEGVRAELDRLNKMEDEIECQMK